MDTEWSSVHGGVTTFNRNLCRALARAGARVYCAVMSATHEQIAEAAAAGVTLIQAPETPGGAERAPLTRRFDLPGGDEPDLIIGHGRITGPAAQVHAADHYERAARLHVVHTVPDETEWAKADEDHDIGERAEGRVKVEWAIMRGATAVAAVGPHLFKQLQRDLSVQVAGPRALRLDPGFDLDNTSERTPPPGGPKQILILGRLEDSLLKGIDIAAKALVRAIDAYGVDGSDIEVLLRGAPVRQHTALRAQFFQWAGRQLPRVTPRSYSDVPQDLEEDFRRASLVLMPSKAEGFGLAGAEAIVAGTPVLVSGRSGLGELLGELLPAEEVQRMVIPVTGDEDDVDRWAKAIASVLSDRPAAFARAASVRHTMARARTWSTAAEQVLSVCRSPQGIARMDETRRRWLSSVQIQLPDRVACLFTGRKAAIDHIAGWFTEDETRRVCVVTGDPGSGKSAVLAWFALGGDPLVGEELYDGDRYAPHPGQVIRVSVHAKGLDLAKVWSAISQQLGVHCAKAEDLERVVAASPGPLGIVIDALEEADDPRDLIIKLVQPIIRKPSLSSVRLLLGTRRHLAKRLRREVEVVDLDEDYTDPVAVEEYVFRILTASGITGLGLSESPRRARRVAVAIGRDAKRSFLIARLTSMTIVERGALPPADHNFPKTVAEAMEGYLDALPLDRRWAENLLRPLAMGKGLGMPTTVWAPLAGTLAGTPGRYTVNDVSDIFDGPLESLITHALQNGEDIPLYRLFHEALNDYMASLPADFPDAPRPGEQAREALARTLLASVPAGADGLSWPDAEPYVRRHLLAHSAGTTLMFRLTRDANFLVFAGRDVVVRSLPDIATVDVEAAHAYESVVQHQGPEISNALRAAYLALGATRLGDVALLRDWWPVRPPAVPWWPLSARWRPIIGHQIVHVHGGAVNRVVVARAFGELLVISGSDDATLAISRLPEASADVTETNEPIADVRRTVHFDCAVRGLAIARADMMPYVVVGTEDGRLRIIDLPGGDQEGAATETGAAVSALIAVPYEKSWLVAAGREDGRLQAWRTELDLVPFRTGTVDGAEIHAFASVAPGVMLLITGLGVLWEWDIGANQVTQRSDGSPRATALAAMPDADLGECAVTGHDDGTLRFWPRSGPSTRTIEVPGDGPVSALAVTRLGGGNLVLVAREESDVRIADATGKGVWGPTLSGPTDPLWDLIAADIDSHPAALGAGEDNSVHLWNLAFLAALRTGADLVEERWSPMRLAEFGSRLMTIAINDQAQFAVLDAMTGELFSGPHPLPPGESPTATTLHVVGDTLWYAICTADATVGVGRDAEPPTWSSNTNPTWTTSARFMELDGSLNLITVSDDGVVSLRDGLGSRPRLRMEQTLREVTSTITTAVTAHVDQDGPVLLVGDRTGRAGIWRLPDLTTLRAPSQLAEERLSSVTLTSKGLMAGCHSGRLSFESTTGLTARAAHTRAVTCLWSSTDRVISGSEDGIVNIWRDRGDDRPIVSIDVGASIHDLLLTRTGALAVATYNGSVLIEIPPIAR
ncbi:glycosyltransferase [Nonomuraea fuscirosea]